MQERLQGVHQQNYSSSHYNLAPKLKKLAKAYGFEYFYRGNGIYILKLQTKNGHFFHLVADTGPSHFSTDFHVSFHGLGFYHELYTVMFSPTNQLEFETCAEKVFEVVDSFRNEMLPLLDVCCPPTPDWFVPIQA